LTKTNAVAIPQALNIAPGSSQALVRYLRAAQISDLAPVTVGAKGQLRLLGFNDTIGSLTGSGIVELLDGTLITGNDNTDTTYTGVISGIGGNLTKTGSATFTLTGDNAYTGTTFVKGGTLLVRGNQPQSEVTIQTGGTLGGDGTVGAIADLSGHVKPGTPLCGILKCSGFNTHNPANQYYVRINGSVPGLDSDQLDVKGSVLLMGGALQLAVNFAGAAGNEYVIVRNDGTDPVTGTFVGLPQNSYVTNNGVVFRITYQGGDGNDIALIQQAKSGPKMGIEKLQDGTLQIKAEGVPNAPYRVEATDDLTPPATWVVIGETKADAAGQISFIDSDAPQHAIRFYRFVLP
jgi:autotransporter-associated beta strand protein